MTYRERALRAMLAMLMVMTLAIPAVSPAPASAADTDFVGGPLPNDTPALVPNDHTPLAVRFNGSGLEPDSTYYVKIRLSLTPSPSGGGALHRGFIWNKDLGEWIRNRGEDWSRFPTVQTDASGNVISANDANWMFFKFGNENDSGEYYIIVSLNKDGTDGTTRNCDTPRLVTVIDMKTEGAWLHNGYETGATDFRRVTLNAEGATGSTNQVLSIHRTEANQIDDDSNGIVDDEDWGPAGATGDWRLAASAETTVNPYIQQNLQLGGNFKMKYADEDIAFGSADTTAPVAPTGLAAAVNGNTATLTWDPATDDVGVTAYHVYRWIDVSSVEFTPPHVKIATTTETTFEDTNLTPGVAYNYEVRAADAATNVSARSNTATAAIPLPSIPIEGLSRFDTAVAASVEAYPAGSDYVIIATGRNWPDALGGTALAGALDAPILLSEPTSLPAATATEISRLKATHAIILGGTGAVSDAVMAAIGDTGDIEDVERIFGDDRYQTADAVALRTIEVLGVDYDGTAFVATGANFPDALAAAPLAAAQGWPLFLAHPTGGLLPGTVTAMGAVDDAIILGGTGAVSTAVQTQLATTMGLSTTRLEGLTRYDTAVAIAGYGVNSAGHVWDRVGIATGEDYPDALAGGVLQGKVGSVMLLTLPTSLHPATETALEANAEEIYFVTFFGGTGAVSDAVRAAALTLVQ
jgi:putative cell wall-binding protein